MRKNFTRLVCVGIASFCMMVVFGQEKVPVERKIVPAEGMRLRASERQRPDSVVEYIDNGRKVNVFYGVANGPGIYHSDVYGAWCTSSSHFYVTFIPDKYYKNIDVKYNSRGLVESLIFTNEDGRRSLCQYKYNSNDYLLSIDYYDSPVGSATWKPSGKTTYIYDTYGNWVERQEYFNGNVTTAYSARTDSQGRIVYSESRGDFGMKFEGEWVY